MYKRMGLLFVLGLIVIIAACNQDSDSSARIESNAIGECAVGSAVGCIGDFVWNDIDQDGIQDVGEPGIPNVTVNLYSDYFATCRPDKTDTFVATTTTDSNGYYIFVDSPSTQVSNKIPGTGEYCVVFIPPVGYTSTLQDVDNDDTVDSDANPEDIDEDPHDNIPPITRGATAVFYHNQDVTDSPPPPHIQPHVDAGFYQAGTSSPSISISKSPDQIIYAPANLDICADGTKPKAIMLEYVGGTCLDSNNTQGSKTDCSDGAPLGAPVQVMVDDSVTVTPDDMSLMISDIVIIESTGDRLSSSTEVVVTDGSGGSQVLDIHTSCSAPIQIGDQFGSMILRGFTAEGSASSSAPGGIAEFTIIVKNTGDVPLTDVTVDDPLTPNCDFTLPEKAPGIPGILEPNESVTYDCTAFGVLETFTNEATATGTPVSGGDSESASDTADVTVVTPPEVCAECKGGVVELTMTYKGSETALVEFYNDKDPKPEDLLFSEMLDPGDSFTVSKPAGDDKLNKDVSLWIDDVKNAAIHTSCSKPIGEGAVFGFFEVTNARSKDNGLVCPVSTECAECDGGVVFITFQYKEVDLGVFNTNDADLVEFYDDDKRDENKLIFRGYLKPGETFSAVGLSDDLKFNSSTSLWVNEVKQAEPHMSCSQPIGPDAIFGDFKVLEVQSKNVRNICPLPPAPECLECKGGVVNITFQYNGLASGNVEFYNDSDNKPEDLLYEGTLAPGASFTVVGPASDLKFNNSTSLWVNDVKQGEPHMSCSQPIGPGSTFGVFSVTEVFSKDNGKVCPVPPTPEAGLCDDGRPQQLTFQYTGDSCSATTNDQEGNLNCSGDPAFASPVEIVYTGKDPAKIGILPAGEVITLNSQFVLEAFARDELHSNSTIEVRQGGTVLQSLEVHTSCSKPIAYGDQFGALKLIDPSGTVF